MKGLSKVIKLVHFAGDFFLINLSFILAYFLKFHENPFYKPRDHYFFLHILFNCIWLLIIIIFKIYEIERVTKIRNTLFHLARSILFHSLVLLGFIVSFNAFYFSRKHLLLTYLILGVLILLWRSIALVVLRYLRMSGQNVRKVIIIGAGPPGIQLYNYLKNDKGSGLQFIGFFDDNSEVSAPNNSIIGPISDVKSFAINNEVDEIFCALPLTSTNKIRDLISFADNNLIRFRIVPDFRGFLNKKVDIDFYNSVVPVLTIRREPLENLSNRFIKRIFDILFSLFVFLCIYPIVFPLIGLLIKLSSKGPILFVQKRSGRNNEVFNCFKFRTMEVNKDSDSVQAVKGDARITWIGKILRKTNLDELPQFINVLKGDMTVVGPRPHMLKHTQEYARLIDKFMVRHLVKPGITGWAQVNGYRGNTSHPKQMLKRVRYDMWYVENWSLALDIKIIFLTVYNMIKGEENAF